MADFLKLRPLGDTILFTFLDKTSGEKGAFSERTRSGIVIAKLVGAQKGERWGKVESVGPDAGVSIGDYVLIEPLMWFRGQFFEDAKIWKTTAAKVLAVTNDESLTVTY